ncbi:GNAT family N-acetyltransferase [Jeotgalibacillus terrae]|uniref:GNAT family N-acetyltransferase n=1 Tax=Jeotgalibacillus terrae TaxID=587735 RepID=A0ABW5ZEG3_9BACL|nr:GNAT family N-acetyltransferase [Jeotgalibacillus terrae]MBM7579122.1 ribosomal protein S18 acetylase RimI-like enzyme [Jeotgalibacillus terrae]
MNIRKATPQDAAGIAKVQVDTWRTTYRGMVPDDYLDQMTYSRREEVWGKIIEDGQIVYVAEDNGEVVGFANGGEERSNKYSGYDGELFAIYILESYQRQGLGRKLIAPLVEDMKVKGLTSMIVCVLEKNDSKQFYEVLGAEKVDTVKINFGGRDLKEAVYGWKDIDQVKL